MNEMHIRRFILECLFRFRFLLRLLMRWCWPHFKLLRYECFFLPFSLWGNSYMSNTLYHTPIRTFFNWYIFVAIPVKIGLIRNCRCLYILQEVMIIKWCPTLKTIIYPLTCILKQMHIESITLVWYEVRT